MFTATFKLNEKWQTSDFAMGRVKVEAFLMGKVGYKLREVTETRCKRKIVLCHFMALQIAQTALS